MQVSFSWKIAEEPGPLGKWADRIAALWDYPLLQFRLAQVALFLAMAFFCGLRAWVGLGASQMFSHDAFMPLDGAWRLLNGQRPHLDFYSYIGVLAYAPTALGVWLAHGGAEGFGYAQALQSFGLGVWAYFLARKRLPDVPAVLFTLAVTLMAVAPFALGYAPLVISPATTYNRYGYAALGLVMLEAFSPRERSDFWGGVSTGSLLALLFFLKVSYFAGALLLIATLLPCRNQTRRRWSGIVLGCAGLAAPFCVYYGFQMLPLLRDLAMVAGAKRVSPRAYLLDSVLSDAAAILGFGAVTAMVLFASRQGRAARSTLIAVVAVCFTGLVLIFGNCEPHGLPLSLLFVLIAIGQFNFRSPGMPHLLRGVLLVWVSVFTAAALAPNVLSFGYAVSVKLGSHRETPLESTALKSFVPTYSDYAYQVFVNDGISLLRQHRRTGDTVMSLDFTNPFSFGLGMKPARGGTTALQFQTTFSERSRPSAEWLFGDAKLVMVPKTFSDGTLQDSIPRLYGPYLKEHFRLIGESAEWRLYRVLNS